LPYLLVCREESRHREHELREVVERSFAWAARFLRLARDYERLESTLKGQRFIAFAVLMEASPYNQPNFIIAS
jgi:hypothetical protein